MDNELKIRIKSIKAKQGQNSGRTVAGSNKSGKKFFTSSYGTTTMPI